MSEIAYPVVTSDWFVDHAGGGTLAECIGGSGDDCIAHARRIAACLNACRDISTEELELVPCGLDIHSRAVTLSMIVAKRLNSGSAAREG